MALEAAYHYYLQLAVVHGTPTQAFILIVFLLLIIRLASARKCKQQLPPSPPGMLPVIGHVHLLDPQTHISIRELDATPTLFVSSPSAAEAVLRTHDHVFASRPPSMAADVAFAPYGEYWRQGRKLLTTHMLSAKKVQSFSHGRQAEVRLVMDKIREAATAVPCKAVDLSELLSGYTNDVMCRAVLGPSYLKEGRNRLFSELTELNVKLLGGFNLEDYFPKIAMANALLRLVSVKARRLNKRWNDLFDEIIHEHVHSTGPSREKDENSEDFIDLMLSLRKQYGLTLDNVKAMLVIPSGTRVLVNTWALGRDPAFWERPEEFMPERFLQEPCAVDDQMRGKDLRFLPFGFGSRICPGMNFGFATMEVLLANLMYHFDWDVPNTKEGTGTGVDMAESFGLTLRRKQKLLLVPRIS